MSTPVLAVGEVLWDCFPDSHHLGGAPLNFAAHVAKLGHPSALLTAVGDDELGTEARALIAKLGVEMRFLQTHPHLPTGVANVTLDSAGVPTFSIPRPAAFDGVRTDEAVLAGVIAWNPSWLYYGSLFASRPEPHSALGRLLSTLPDARRFCDINLRPGCVDPSRISDLLSHAHVLKLSEEELQTLARMLGLPAGMRQFCAAGSERFGWQTVAITLGPKGCMLWQPDRFVEAPGVPVSVADTVGAGDAFSAALLHGIDVGWAPQHIAAFANRVGSIVASRSGAIPAWTPEEAYD